MKSFSFPPDAPLHSFSGVIEPARALFVLDRVIEEEISTTVVFCRSTADARSLVGQTDTLRGLIAENAILLNIVFLPPPPEENPSDPLPARLREELECDRLGALSALSVASKKRPVLLFTTPEAFFQPVAPIQTFLDSEISLARGQEIDFATLVERLAKELDYDSEPICERPGEFAIRGGLIDIYPLNANAPVRLDFFGDEIESIRRFDPTTQRSIEILESITVAARSLGHQEPTPQGIFSYFDQKTQWIFLDADQLYEAFPRHFETMERLDDQRANVPTLYKNRHLAGDVWTLVQELPVQNSLISKDNPFTHLSFESLHSWRPQPVLNQVGGDRFDEEIEARRSFTKTLANWHHSEGTLLFGCAPSKPRMDEVQSVLEQIGFKDLPCTFREAELSEGFVLRGPLPGKAFRWLSPKKNGFALVTEKEWLGRNQTVTTSASRRLLPQRKQIEALLDFSELADGDYLVHLSHGICRYRGLQKMDVSGRPEEYISVEFQDQVTLHVPLREAHLLTRYVGLTRIHPKLGRIGSPNWEKTRAAAEAATVDFAADMLRLQAVRAHQPGRAFSPDTEWQKLFEAAFPYRETPDQAAAITASKEDMERPHPMDRLVCGDVGFGKTEVAIRAAFKAVMDGTQVAIMVPTTVLAQQHFETLRERFAAYPVSVEMLSRFRSASQQKTILKDLSSGRLDIVIGTHRLLSKDVRFHNLGLLIVDEEHRFGVRHKEKLKQLKVDVDVLSMSATPIPRTLYLALMGARDLSVIETPPAERLPIETLVRSYDPQLVEQAIRRELDRGGQVFYLHNRVQTIDSVAAQLNDRIPEARIAVGHGQMPEHQLEALMTDFVAGKIDVLVCTTIIENGLDIPNCNTILIEGADRFGLSQLYQLRGRVGRFKRQAYAYLLLHRHGRMLDLARKRLSAMRQHNQLGAGFRIAMRDLELRGAGNLLGHQQSGHIAGVGFDLYCQLLRQSIQRLKGEPVAQRIRAHVVLDFIQEDQKDNASRASSGAFAALQEEEIAASRIDPVRAHLPTEYIPEAKLRIDYYRQLAMADTLEAVKENQAALKDRFGKIPASAERLLAITRIRIRAEMAGMRVVETEGNRLKCQFAKSGPREFYKLSGRFPRLTGKTADLRLRDIEQILARLCHNPTL
jgi:transcription-repair coupling factor (superfamily II helicase)